MLQPAPQVMGMAGGDGKECYQGVLCGCHKAQTVPDEPASGDLHPRAR